MTRRAPRTKKLSSSAALKEHQSRGERFQFLRQRLRRVDVEEVWEHLEADLSLGDGRANPEKILRALDSAEANLRRAGMLLQVAIEEYDEFEVHYRAAYSEWSRHARDALERDKKEKRMSGQVTTELIENWIAATVPDYARWREVRRDLERNKNLCKQMFAAWESRSASLRKQADLVERRRGVSTDMLPRRGEEKKNGSD
jgi:hypothetical protein